jgi:hypothetical protein
MSPDGAADARKWMRHAPPEVISRVQRMLSVEPAMQTLRAALNRTSRATDDEFTRLVAERYRDDAYANEFGKTLLRPRISPMSLVSLAHPGLPLLRREPRMRTPDGDQDVRAWTVEAPPSVVRMVRAAVRAKPTPHALGSTSRTTCSPARRRVCELQENQLAGIDHATDISRFGRRGRRCASLVQRYELRRNSSTRVALMPWFPRIKSRWLT